MSPPTVVNHVAHIKAHYTLAGADPNPATHCRVVQAIQAIKRRKDHTPKPLIPLSLPVLRTVLAYVAKQRMYNMRAVIAIMFYGALRLAQLLPLTVRAFDPLKHLTRAVVWIAGGALMIRVKHAKNMQYYNQPRTVTLTQSPSAPLCPIVAIRSLLRHMPTENKSQPMFVFPQSQRPLPASYARRKWSTLVRHLGMDPTRHTMHSIRKMAATAAYDKGCLDPQIQNFGGWASKAYQTYIQRDNQSLVNNALVESMHNS